MKKMALSFLIFSLMMALNISGQDIREFNTQKSNFSLLNSDFDSDEDDFAEIECSLFPIERKSHAPCFQPVGASIVQTVNSNSLNWSGYAAITGKSKKPNPTFNSVTEVSGSWVVPKLIPDVNGDTFSSAWVGIDGYSNAVVEQIGTEHDVINGASSYYAWFSLFPAPTQVIDGFPVKTGDIIEGRVHYKGQDDSGNSIFHLTIKNRTRKVKFSTTQHTLPGNPAHLSSAEWIVEAPGIVDPRIACINFAFLPLANFKKISFDKCKATINGREGGIKNKHWTFDAITMVSGTTIKAIPSALRKESHSECSKSKENSFNVKWANSGPFPFEVFCPPILP